jgi:hypothetical protein
MNNPITDLAVLERYGALAITAHDPRLPTIASRLGFKSSERLLTQIQEHIPAALEQQIFVAMASDGYGLRPMKFAEILAAHRGPSPLTPSAFERKEVSPGVFFSSIDAFQDFVDTIVSLVEEVKDSDFACSTRSAIALVQTYGEHAEAVLDSVLKYAEEIYAAIGKKPKRGDGPNKIASIAVNYLARTIIPACQKVGIPAPLNVMDFFEETTYARARAICVSEGECFNAIPMADHTAEGAYHGDE